MKPLYLYPRLNYKYTLSDAFYSFIGIFKKNVSEESIREMFGGSELIYFNHARAALTVLLRSLNLNKNTGVAMMGFNCLTVMNSINAAGMKPVFIDIGDEFSIDVVDLKKKRKQFEVFVINHMFGIPNKTIFEIKTIFPDLIIIEDCTHAFYSSINSQLCGTIGDFSIFSYGMAKFPSVMDGGFLVINNIGYTKTINDETDKLNEISKLKEIKNIFKGVVVSSLFNPFIYALAKNKYVNDLDKKHDVVGKYHQSETKHYKSNKYLFLKRMNHINKLLAKQKENGQQIKGLIPKENIIFDGDYNFFMLPVIMPERKKLLTFSADNGVEIGTHFAKSILWAQTFGYKMGDCKNAEFMAGNIITIPTHYNMRKKQLRKIKIVLTKYFGEKK